MQRVWIFAVVAVACAGVAVRGEEKGAETQGVDPIAKALDDLSGDMATRAGAMNVLEAADVKVAVPAIVARLKKNAKDGAGTTRRSQHMVMKDPAATAPWVRLEAENLMMVRLLVDCRAKEAAGAVQGALDLAMKQDAEHKDGALTRELAVAVYQLSGKRPKYWDFEKQEERELLPTAAEEKGMRKVQGIADEVEEQPVEG